MIREVRMWIICFLLWINLYELIRLLGMGVFFVGRMRVVVVLFVGLFVSIDGDIIISFFDWFSVFREGEVLRLEDN